MAELISAGATGIQIGSQVVTGSAPFIGPFSAHAGVEVSIVGKPYLFSESGSN
jgi:hypothetical protein